MASLFSMSKSQLMSLQRDQQRAIEDHQKKGAYTNDRRKHEYTLKRLRQRLSDIDQALQRF